jgi:Icc-related predicted phosphoesterase
LRIVAISDTHNHDRFAIPEGDLLIHCGDALGRGSYAELVKFNEWLGALKFQQILYVAGNHDWIFQAEKKLAIETLASARYVEDELVEVGGLKVYGSPWTKVFMNWAFMLPEERLELAFDLIPGGLDILVTHGPPLGILDCAIPGRHLGSMALLAAVKRAKPKYHLFGHIHEGHGSTAAGQTQFFNCALMTGDHRPANKPIVFDIGD